jgi:beta-galactosidase
MSRTILLLSATALVSVAGERWQDPGIFAVNRLPAHAFSLVFPDEKSVAPQPDWSDPYAGSSRFESLNGEWAFKWASSLAHAPSGFERSDFDVSLWDRIPVPSPWQVHGYGQLYYFNAYLPFLGDPRNPDHPKNPTEQTEMAAAGWIPTVFNPVGSYRRSFTVPANWQGMSVILHFGGVQSAFTCWINGREVGYSEDSYTPAEFDITPYLVPGSNTLAVQVIRWSDGSYMENQDMIRMSGIIRDVMLIARPPLHIADFYLVPSLDPSLKQGAMSAQISLLNSATNVSRKSEVELTLLDEFGRAVLHAGASAAALQPGQTGTVHVRNAALRNPELWHPESPRLYTALLTLKEEGKVNEVIRQDVAFRRFDWDESGNFHLNGKRFYLRGANRHDTSPETGRTISYAEMLDDARLMKRLNVNTVRNAHYPRDPRWYALCARYGIAVIDECNLETHSNEVILSDDHPEWRQQALFRVRNMILRNRNEPAILIWSLGNEQFFGWPQTVQEQAALAKELDPARGIMAERAWDYKQDVIQGKGVIDFVAPMYGGIGRAKAYLKHWEQGEHRPFFYCEYAHAMGNSMAELGDIWAFQEQHDGLNGGCIWDWVDQALRMSLPGAREKWFTYGGDWGEFGSGRVFCMNGLLLPDRGYTGKSYEVHGVYQQVAFKPAADQLAAVRVQNKFATRNLKDFETGWVLLENGRPIQSGRLDLDVAPLSEQTVALPFALPAAKPGIRYDVNFDVKLKKKELWADSGYPVAVGQIHLAVPDLPRPEMPSESLTGGAVRVSENADSIDVTTTNLLVRFDRRTAVLAQIYFQGTALLAPDAALPGVELNTGAKATDDRIMWPPGAMGMELKDGYNDLARSPVDVKVSEEGAGFVRVTAVAEHLRPGKKDGMRHTAIYTVVSSGVIDVDNRVQKIDLAADALNFRIGVRIPAAREFSTAEYAAYGPHENYAARRAASRYGDYTQDAGRFFVNYVRPQECGNRSGLDWIALRNKEGLGFVVVPSKTGDGSVMPWTREQMEKADHVPQLPPGTRWILRYDARQAILPSGSRVAFDGDMSFSYSIRPLEKNSAAWNVALLRIPAALASRVALTGQPLIRREPLPSGWVNVSSNATVTYSSTSGFAVYKDTLLTAQQFPFAFHTGEEKEPWLIMDLKKIQPVAGLRILNRSDAQGNRTRNLHVWLSEDGKTWKQVFAGSAPQAHWDIRLPANEPARFVKIGLINSQPVFFHLRGVEVFAEVK